MAIEAQADGDPQNGKMLAREWECARCHGLDGNARSIKARPTPMIAGQPEIYLAKEMKNYRDGNRVDPNDWSKMTRMLQDLSDQDIDDLAAYYASQKRY